VGIDAQDDRIRQAPFVALSLLVAGCVLSVRGWTKLWLACRITRRGIPAEGIITAITPTIGAWGQRTVTDWAWLLEYRFADRSGREHWGSVHLAPDDVAACRAGDACRIRYDESRPARSLWTGRLERPSDRTARGVEPSVLAASALSRASPFGVGAITLGLFFLLIGLDEARLERQPFSSRALATPMGAIGAALLVAGGALKLRAWRLGTRRAHAAQHGITTGGVVTALRRSSLVVDAAASRWFVRYRYEDDVGNAHRGEGGPFAGAEVVNVRVGDGCRVRYDPQHPHVSLWMGVDRG
jgi:hypothetical protein